MSSDDIHREILDGIDAVVYEVDATGVLTYVNPAIETVLGYSVSEAVGRQIKELVLEEDRPNLEQNFPTIISGQPAANEYRVVTKSGDVRWVRTSSYPVLESGRMTKVRGVLQDIDELKRVELELQASQAHLERAVVTRTEELSGSEANLSGFLDGTDDRICSRDRNGALLMWNRSFADSIRDHFGVEPYVGLRTGECVPAENLKYTKHLAGAHRRVFDGETVRDEYSYPSPSGEIRHYEVSMSPITIGDEIVAAAEITRDVTERKNAQLAVQRHDELFRAYLRASGEPLWSFAVDPPMPMNLSIDSQLDYLYEHASVVVANDAWAQEAGYDRGDAMVGMRLDEIVPRSEPRNVDTLRALAESGYGLDNIITHDRNLQGEVRVILNSFAAEISDGHLVRAWGASRDITSQESDRQKLREAEQRYRTVADFTYDWEYWESPDGELLYVSPSCERISGYTAQDFVANPRLLGELILDADRSTWDRHVADEATSRDPIQFRIRSKNGQIRWVEHACARVSGADGESLGIRGSNRDVTDRKEAEGALRKEEAESAAAKEEARLHRELLAHADRIASMEGLASSMAHELSQPLAGILSNAQAAIRYLRAERPDLAEIGAILHDIVADDKRAGEIIRRLRSFARKEAAKHVPIDVNALVREVVEIMASEAIIQQLLIRQEFAEQLPEVLGDRVQLQQVLVNLIMNAQQAVVGLPDNRRDITLRAGVFSDEAVVVEVQDRGPGIDFSKGDVFEPFITSKPDGMGMGLPICRSLIESHGGSIWAENAPDGGACVRFTLPTAAARRDTK